MAQRRSTCVCAAVMRLMKLLVVGAACGVADGLVELAMNPKALRPSIVASWVATGVVLATVAWLGCLPRLRQLRPEETDVDLDDADWDAPTQSRRPTPFLTRLAKYLNCEESDLAMPGSRPQSRMPFWTTVSLDQWHGPKPASSIRRILERIRHHIHGA